MNGFAPTLGRVSASAILNKLMDGYYHTSVTLSYDNSTTDVETLRLEPLRIPPGPALMQGLIAVRCSSI